MLGANAATCRGFCGYGSPCSPQGDCDAYGREEVRWVSGTIETMQDTLDDCAKDIVRPVACQVRTSKAEVPTSENAMATPTSTARLKADNTDRVRGPRDHLQP